MLRILASNWVAVPILIGATLSLVLLYITGRRWEAFVGAAILLVALVLVLSDRGGSKPDNPAASPKNLR